MFDYTETHLKFNFFPPNFAVDFGNEVFYLDHPYPIRSVLNGVIYIVDNYGEIRGIEDKLGRHKEEINE